MFAVDTLVLPKVTLHQFRMSEQRLPIALRILIVQHFDYLRVMLLQLRIMAAHQVLVNIKSQVILFQRCTVLPKRLRLLLRFGLQVWKLHFVV